MINILVWIIVGGIAGWLAGLVVQGTGLGVIGDIIVGIVGALIGGLLGHAASGGRTGAAVAGVVVGGAVGAALTSNLDCEDRSYAYKTYYTGFNAGRVNRDYNWRNPSNNHRGTFRVGRYYNDPDGFRCANYSQTAYIGSQRHIANGNACRQPDGTWAMVN